MDKALTPEQVAAEVGSDDRRLSPAERHVRSLGGEFLMVREVAELLGLSTASVRKLIPNEDLDAPSFWVRFGEKAQIYLYTAQDIEELRDYLSGIRKVRPMSSGKLGRPPKYTEEQKKQKRSEYNRAYYNKRKTLRKDGADESGD